MLFAPTFFWNRMARGYAKKPVADQAAYEHKLNLTASYLRPTDRIMEFGCGTGTTALIHAPRVTRIDAFDFSSEMIAIAREKAETQGIVNAHFEVADFAKWTPPSGDDRYDAVLGMSILHLVRDLDATLAKVNRALKPGGLFFSSTVCLAEIGGVVKHLLPPLGAIGILPKILPLTGDALIERMVDHGFAIEQTWRPKTEGTIFIVARKSND